MELALDDEGIARRLAFVGFTPDDREKLARIRPVIERNAPALAGTFFGHLEGLPEARGLLSDRALMSEARGLKEQHTRALARGDYGRAYVDERVRLAQLYTRAQLPVTAFLAGFHGMMSKAAEVLAAELGAGATAELTSLRKVFFFDIGVIVDVLIDARERVIADQQLAIRELSTPVLQLRPGLVVLPMIGTMDTARAAQLTARLLAAVRERRVRVAILDVTGVATVDSRVAASILHTADAARMMGARVLVTGIATDVARSLVGLGFDVEQLACFGDLEDGVLEADRILAA